MRCVRCASGEGMLEVIHMQRVIVVEGGVEMSLTCSRRKGMVSTIEGFHCIKSGWDFKLFLKIAEFQAQHLSGDLTPRDS